jgi:hypothetical protein
VTRASLNDTKRDAMSHTVNKLLRSDWTTKQLAALLGVAVGTVGTWKRGASMGTNSQRNELNKLLRVDAKEYREEARRILRTALESYRLRAAREIERAEVMDRTDPLPPGVTMGMGETTRAPGARRRWNRGIAEQEARIAGLEEA